MSADTHHVPGAALLAGAGAVIVAAIIGIVLLGDGGVTEYDPASPEAAAQTFLQALFDGDFAMAHDVLAPSAQARCRDYELDFDHGPDMNRAVFDDVDRTGDTAIISLRITSNDYSPEPLPIINSADIETRLVLEQIDGEWRIVDADWPLNRCDWR